MRFDYVDLLCSDRLPVDDAVGMIAGLIEAGMARAWGALNWDPDQIELAGQIAERAGVPGTVSWRLYSSSVSPSPLRACRLRQAILRTCWRPPRLGHRANKYFTLLTLAGIVLYMNRQLAVGKDD